MGSQAWLQFQMQELLCVSGGCASDPSSSSSDMTGSNPLPSVGSQFALRSSSLAQWLLWFESTFVQPYPAGILAFNATLARHPDSLSKWWRATFMDTQIEVVGDIHLRKTMLTSADPPGERQLSSPSQKDYAAPNCRNSWGQGQSDTAVLNTRDAHTRAAQWRSLIGQGEGVQVPSWFGGNMSQITAEIVLWNSERAEMLLLRVDSMLPAVGLLQTTVHTVDVTPMGGGWNCPSPAFSALLLLYLVFHIATVASKWYQIFKSELFTQSANIQAKKVFPTDNDAPMDSPRDDNRLGCCAACMLLQ